MGGVVPHCYAAFFGIVSSTFYFFAENWYSVVGRSFLKANNMLPFRSFCGKHNLARWCWKYQNCCFFSLWHTQRFSAHSSRATAGISVKMVRQKVRKDPEQNLVGCLDEFGISSSFERKNIMPVSWHTWHGMTQKWCYKQWRLCWWAGMAAAPSVLFHGGQDGQELPFLLQSFHLSYLVKVHLPAL